MELSARDKKGEKWEALGDTAVLFKETSSAKVATESSSQQNNLSDRGDKLIWVSEYSEFP